jgi:hypothetical protein
MPVSRAKIAVGVPLGLAVSEVVSFWLRRADPHPVGLATAPTMPKMLGPHSWDKGLTDVCLVYGYPHPLDVARPLIEVMTCFRVARCHLPSIKKALTRAKHRDAAWAGGEWENATGPFSASHPEAPIPDSGFAYQRRTVVIDSEQRTVAAVSFGQYEALRFRHGTMVVTAVARFGFPDTLSFQTVDDLRPYAAGFRRFMVSLLLRLREA